MQSDGEGETAAISDKPRRPRSRVVSSRYLSRIATSEMPPPSPTHSLSPNGQQKPRSSTDSRKTHHGTGFIRGLWPSSTPPPPPPPSKSQNENAPTTLGDHLGDERRKGHHPKSSDNSTPLINRQRSCSEFSRFENNLKQTSTNSESSLKENHKPLFGGSMRYTGKFQLPGRSSLSSSSTPSSKSSNSLNDNVVILPGRMSVDENALRRKSYSRRSDSFSDDLECSDLGSPFVRKTYMASTVSSRKSGIDIPSKYMNAVSLDSSHAMKRADSLIMSSPGRTELPPSGGIPSFSSLKPPSSPSRAKNFLNTGLDLIKGKKGRSSGSLSPRSEYACGYGYGYGYGCRCGYSG